MSYTDKTVGLYSEVYARHFVNRSNIIYVRIGFETSFSNMKTHVHMLIGDRSMCFFENKSKVRYVVWYDSLGQWYLGEEQPRDVLIPSDASFIGVNETFRVYALGYIVNKSYGVSLETDTVTVGDTELTYRYLRAVIQSRGVNFRYGVRVYGIPVIGTIYFEHVHTEESDATTDITVSLFTTRM